MTPLRARADQRTALRAAEPLLPPLQGAPVSDRPADTGPATASGHSGFAGGGDDPARQFRDIGIGAPAGA